MVDRPTDAPPDHSLALPSLPATTPTAQEWLALINRSPLVVYRCEVTFPYRATFITDNVRTLLGYEPQEFLCQSDFLTRHLHPEDRDRVYRELQHLDSAETLILEYRFRHSHGHYLWLRDDLRVLRDSQSQPQEVLGSWLDITDHRQAELVLSQQLEVIEAAIDGIAIVQRDRYLYVNQAHCTLFGYGNPEELIGYSWQQLYGPEEQTRFYHEIFPSLQAQGRWQGEAIALRRDGSSFVEGVSLTLTPDGLMICVCRDITETKQKEHLIQQQVQRSNLLRAVSQRIQNSPELQSLFETACREIRQVLQADRVGIFQFQPQGLQINYGQGEFIAESATSGVGSVLAQAVHDHCFGTTFAPRYAQGHYAVIDDVQRSELQPCHRQLLAHFQVRAGLILPLTLGSRLWGLLCIHQCHAPRQWQPEEIDLGQQLTHQLAIALQQAHLVSELQRELAGRQQAQAQLEERSQQLAETNRQLQQATRLKDEFLARMSHELRTPLNAILGMTEGFQEMGFGPLTPGQVSALSTIERSGNHLLSPINDILDVATIEAGQTTLDWGAIAVIPFCQTSLSFIQPQADKKGLTLRCHLPQGLPPLRGDQRRLRQVLINLLSNAVKFTPQEGTIVVEAKRLSPCETPAPGSWLALSVTDTGIGIDPAHQGQIFEPFHQIESALNRKYQGTGLGLTLVKHLVELHGGRVSLTSCLGQGSTFTVTLPLCDSDDSGPSVIPTSQLSAPTPSLANYPGRMVGDSPSRIPRILLAEPQGVSQDSTHNYLQARGYVVQVVQTGQEAVALSQQWRPAVILLDEQLPWEAAEKGREAPGLQTIAALRATVASDPSAPVAILALVTPAPKARDRALAAGAQDTLAKPLKFRHLNDLLYRHLHPWVAEEPAELPRGRTGDSGISRSL